MPFKKGKSGNKDGRPMGSPNHLTQETRLLLKQVIEKEIENIELYLSRIKKPETKLKLLIDLLPYVLPKLQNTNLTIDPPEPVKKNVIRLADGTEIEI